MFGVFLLFFGRLKHLCEQKWCCCSRCFVSCFGFGCVLLLFLRVLGRGFFGFLVSLAGGYVNSALFVLSALFLLVFALF